MFSQSIVWVGFFLLTELKLLKLKNQEDSFSLDMCSVLCCLIPKGSDYKIPISWNWGRFKGYKGMLGENVLIYILKCHVAIHIKNMSLGW